MLIGDGFFFIVGKDDPTAARQTVRGFLKSFCFTFSGVFFAKGVTYLDGKFCVRDIKVDFKNIMIKENVFVFGVMTISA